MNALSCCRFKPVLHSSFLLLFAAILITTLFESCAKTPNDTVPIVGSISGRITTVPRRHRLPMFRLQRYPLQLVS